MEIDEIKAAWQQQDVRDYSEDTLQAILQEGRHREYKRLYKSIQTDFLVALALLIFCISAAFILDLRYRWFVVLAMAGFSAALTVHFIVKIHTLKQGNGRDLPLQEMIAHQLTWLKHYKRLYLFSIPLLSSSLTIVYALFYTDLSIATGLFTCTGVAIFTFLLTRQLWHALYHRHLRRYNALEKIHRRLR